MAERSRRMPAWLRTYPRQHLGADLLAGLLVGVLVIPQSLGYAMLAGLPPVYGLYASILPVLAYAWVGSSNTQAVGPVAVTSIMTAHALSGLDLSVAGYAAHAVLLAALVGGWLLLAGLLRLGWVTQFMGRGVMSGLVSGAALLIALSQLKYILGLPLHGDTLFDLLHSAFGSGGRVHALTALTGVSTVVVLWASRRWLAAGLVHWGMPHSSAQSLTRMVPLLVLILITLLSDGIDLAAQGVAVVGPFAAGLPPLLWPDWPSSQTLQGLLPASALIALVAFVSSVSVAQEIAYRRHEPFEANRELLGLGAANLAAALQQGFPVTGGFSRTAVNLEAGAQTPLAGVVAAAVIALVLVFLSGALAALPLAVLGAGIWVVVLRMVDMATLRQAWRSDRREALTWLVTCGAVLLLGMQWGLMVGLVWSLAGLIERSAHPHVAVVGALLNDPSHFRNVERHEVYCPAGLVLIRIDESIFFGNSRSIERQILSAVDQRSAIEHVVLMGSGINDIDLTGQLMLTGLNRLLADRGIALHLAEIKGPVMDDLQHSPLLPALSGQVYLSMHEAVRTLAPAEPHSV